MSRYPCCGTNLEVLLPLFVKAFSVSCNFQSVGTLWITPVLLIQYKLAFKKFHGFNSFSSSKKRKKGYQQCSGVPGYDKADCFWHLWRNHVGANNSNKLWFLPSPRKCLLLLPVIGLSGGKSRTIWSLKLTWPMSPDSCLINKQQKKSLMWDSPLYAVNTIGE